MNVARKLQRQKLKEEWKKFKRENRQYKNMAFAQFSKLWKDSMLQQENRILAQDLTEEQESELENMFLEEVIEGDEDITAE